MMDPTSFASEVDKQDQLLLSSLAANGRASWQALGERTGISGSTAQRRAARLIEAGLLRIIGTSDALASGLGITALVRLHCSAEHVAEVQSSLTARPDVRFCASTTGTTSLVADMTTRSMGDLQAALAEITAELPVTSTESFPLTRGFTAPFTVLPAADPRRLPADTGQNAPRPDAVHGVPPLAIHATDMERSIFAELIQDGRKPVTDIAASIGYAESAVRKCMEEMISSGRLRVGPLIAPGALGLDVGLFIWLGVDPSMARDAAAALVSMPGVHAAFAALGRFNLVAQVFLPNISDVYAFSTDRLGSLPGLRAVDTTVHIHTSKRMWICIEGGRFAPHPPIRPTITLPSTR